MTCEGKAWEGRGTYSEQRVEMQALGRGKGVGEGVESKQCFQGWGVEERSEVMQS